MHDTLTRALGGTTPTTLDRQARTVQVVALSGLAPAVRPAPAPDGSRTAWVEELVAAGADLSRFRNGPALKDHRNTTDAAVGSVAEARIEGDRIVSTVRFDASVAADELMGKVESGSVRGVSLGYGVTRWQAAGKRNGLPVFQAVTWAPHELSFTPVPVDAGAVVRSDQGANMTVLNGNVPADNGATIINVPADTTIQNRAVVNAEIRAIGRTAGMDQAWVDGQLDASATPDQARAAAFAEMSRRGGGPIQVHSSIQVGIDHTDPSAARRAMSDALAARLMPGAIKLEGRAVEYRGFRALDMVAELALARGQRFNRFDPDACMERAIGAHSTGDFPLLLADVGNKILLAQYSAAAPTYRRWAARKSFTDFRAHRFLRIGDFPSYKSVAEAGGVKYGTLSENRETVTPGEFVTGISLGRRLLMSDDLGALADFSSMIAIRTAADENRMVYELIASDGPTLSDNVALFNSAHGNKAGSGSDIDVASVGAARMAMREQTSLDGLKLNVEGQFMLCGSAKEMKARQVLTSVTPTKASDVNPWSGSCELIVDSNISGTRWHIFANPAMYPVVVYGYVAGSDGPQIKTEVDFDTQAVKIRAGLDFACGVIDYRGAYLNTGA